MGHIVQNMPRATTTVDRQVMITWALFGKIQMSLKPSFATSECYGLLIISAAAFVQGWKPSNLYYKHTNWGRTTTINSIAIGKKSMHVWGLWVVLFCGGEGGEGGDCPFSLNRPVGSLKLRQGKKTDKNILTWKKKSRRRCLIYFKSNNFSEIRLYPKKHMKIFGVLLGANITTVFHRWCFSITVQIYNHDKNKEPCNFFGVKQETAQTLFFGGRDRTSENQKHFLTLLTSQLAYWETIFTVTDPGFPNLFL